MAGQRGHWGQAGSRRVTEVTWGHLGSHEVTGVTAAKKWLRLEYGGQVGSPWSQEVTEAKMRSQGLCGSLRPLGAIWGSSGVMKGHRGHWRQDGSGWATWGHLRSPEATEVIGFTEVTWSQTGSGEETPSTLTPLPHTHSCVS